MQFPELPAREPASFLMLLQLVPCMVRTANKRYQFNNKIRILVPENRQSFDYGHHHLQFFTEFSEQAGFIRFSGLDFPAGKLPFQGLMSMRAPLGSKYPFTVNNNRTSYTYNRKMHVCNVYWGRDRK